MKNIQHLWAELSAASLPSNLSNVAINGIDPCLINRQAADCIRTFLGHNGTLDPAHKQTLSQCLSDMEILNPTLVGEAQVYFGKLYRLCDLIRDRC